MIKNKILQKRRDFIKLFFLLKKEVYDCLFRVYYVIRLKFMLFKCINMSIDHTWLIYWFLKN